MNSGSGTSGSTAWNNSVRSRLYLTKADADGDPDIRILKAMKANYAPSLSDLRLRRQGLGFDLEEGGEGRPTGAVARASVDRQFLDLLAAYDAAGRPVRHSTGHGYAPALFAKDPAAKGTTKKGFEEAMNRLFTAGEIKSLEEGPASRRSSRIVRVRSGGE
jgi:RecA-family ATPase